MTIKYFSQDNYIELCDWWNKHNHFVVAAGSLPYGVVVSDGDKNLVMSFLYTMDGCDIAQIAWTTSNPENKLKQNYAAIDLAIDAVLLLAKKMNKKNVICFSSSNGLNKMFNKKGLKSNMSHTLNSGAL